LVIGQYAVAWHLPGETSERLTDVVAAWRRHWPTVVPMPHPSPRNQRWLRNNAWFERDVLPALRARVRELVAG
jgi:uracil-DNA glycosylase